MKWEYKSLKLAASGWMGGKFDEDELEKLMNELGRKEWEMVSAFDTNQGSGQTRDIVILFKRSL